MTYKLHYSKINSTEDVEELLFNNIFEVIGHIALYSSSNCVFLVAIDEDVFVCSNTKKAVGFIQDYLPHHKLLNHPKMLEMLELSGMEIKLPIIHFQEYESYEEAYKVALDMKEVDPLCYSK